MMCKVKTLLFGSKYEIRALNFPPQSDGKLSASWGGAPHKNEFEDKYILANQALKQISTQIYYVEHKIIKPIEGIFNIQSILLIYVEIYKSI